MAESLLEVLDTADPAAGGIPAEFPHDSSCALLTVPPTTPDPVFSFDNLTPTQFKFTKPNLEECKLPYVREVGIKTSIEILSSYFNCEDYKFNAVQFWFLDVITDCLWKMQDEYQFPERYQKVILQWVLFAINLIKDPQKILSRKQFFSIFNEALSMAKEQIQAGCDILPSPEDMFSLKEVEEKEKSSLNDSENSSISASRESSGESYVAVGMDESTEIFKLPKTQLVPHQKKSSSKSALLLDEEMIAEEEEKVHSSEESVEFYQPDLNIPDRFLSSSSSYVSGPGEDDDLLLNQERFFWKESSSISMKKSCSEIIMNTPVDKNSSLGTVEDNVKEEWNAYLQDRQGYLLDEEMKLYINTCVLVAIKQFIYDYFHESFQYTVVQLGLINVYTTISQHVNKEWHVPKILKEELKKPKPKKVKKPKKPKEQKKKKEKNKKPKKDKKPKDKKGKKEKKPKKPQLTKEEKAELAREKKRQKELEEQHRKEEENRRLLFPLNEAATDDFFRGIYPRWTRPKAKGKGKKKK